VASFPVKDGKATPGKVAIYSTCYVNHNEPGIGHDLLKILAHNEVPAVIFCRGWEQPPRGKSIRSR